MQQTKRRLFLASSICTTGEAVAKDMGRNPSDMRVAFVTTAAEPDDVHAEWLKNDRDGLARGGFTLFDYTITGKTPNELESDLASIDAIHVNGGNTFYLLLQARKSGFAAWARRAVDNGLVYIGSSAGSIIAAPNIEITQKLETAVYEKELGSFEGLGLVDFITLPHWGSEDFRELYLNHRFDMAYKPEHKILLLNDWQYVRVDGETYRIVEIPR